MDGLPRSGTTLSETYRMFAAREAAGQSPIYEALCLGISSDPSLLSLISALPLLKQQVNLVLAASRWHGAPLVSYVDFSAFVIDHWVSIRDTIMSRSTQTNEPGRCAVLLPLLASLPGPLALIEVGASAGLCLYPDRYAYMYDGARVGSSPAVFPCAVSNGHVPSVLPTVVWRAGLDLNPLDIRDADSVAWLENLIWPGQEERLARFRAAVSIVRSSPPLLVAGDLLHDLGALIALAPRSATLVVYHTAVLAYVSPSDRLLFISQMNALSGHWISNEAPGIVPLDGPLPEGKFVLALDGTPVAHTGSHGQSLTWL